MKKILLLLSMLMFIFTATVSAASAVFLKNQWYEPVKEQQSTSEYLQRIILLIIAISMTDLLLRLIFRQTSIRPSRALTAMAVFLRMNTAPALLSAAVIIWA